MKIIRNEPVDFLTCKKPCPQETLSKQWYLRNYRIYTSRMVAQVWTIGYKFHCWYLLSGFWICFRRVLLGLEKTFASSTEPWNRREHQIKDTDFTKHIEAETKCPPFHRQHFQVHFLDLNIWISIKISLIFVAEGSINNIPALFHWPGNKPSNDRHRQTYWSSDIGW